MRLFFNAYDASRIACLEGDLDGCVMAGELIEDGRGVDQDLEQALAFYDRACGGGDSRGCERAAAHR
jgi:TPR repeat protein